ncbi:hypothetical protein, partial [Rhizobium alvei]|uniref:hypothetical protein n=1 Tax=Rhizobium alvei TaxID=1132659 RepID=UPI0033958C4A
DGKPQTLKPKATADTRRPRLSFFLSYNLKELTEILSITLAQKAKISLTRINRNRSIFSSISRASSLVASSARRPRLDAAYRPGVSALSTRFFSRNSFFL